MKYFPHFITIFVIISFIGGIVAFLFISSDVSISENVKDKYFGIPSIPSSAVLARTSDPYPDTWRNTLFTDTNNYRISKGLKPLMRNRLLDVSACAKAKDMDDKNYWDHYGPNGEKPWQFFLAAGYKYGYAGENLAKDFTYPTLITPAWIKSPSHEKNLSNKYFLDVGYCVINATLPYCPQAKLEEHCEDNLDGRIQFSILVVQHLGII